MKKYIGTKLIEAEKAFKIGDKIYSNENDEINEVALAEGEIAVMGYKVRYADGYESFSPKNVFEKAYLPLQENENLKTDMPSISEKMVEDFIADTSVFTLGEKTTVVRAVLANGFELVESSSCVSEENYDEELGAEICMKKIRDKVWFLLGFLLQTAVNGIQNKENAVEDEEKDMQEVHIEIHRNADGVVEGHMDGYSDAIIAMLISALRRAANAGKRGRKDAEKNA